MFLQSPYFGRGVAKIKKKKLKTKEKIINNHKNKKKMKKVFLILGTFFVMTMVHAQEKGLHLTLGGGLGWTNFTYNLNGGSYKGNLGYGGTIGAQYFFNRHWGISLAGQFYAYNTQSRYGNKLFTFANQIDNEKDMYDFRLRLKNWVENQTTYFVEIPLMVMYQHKFGKQEKHGIYFGVGAKVQIPVGKSTFKREDGTVATSGFYPKWNLTLGEDGYSVPMPHHAFGTNENRDWSGENELKVSYGAVGEFGFLFGLGRRVDLTIGAEADYGFRNIKKQNKDFVGPIAGVTQQDGSYVAENVYYNGVLNSTEIKNIHPFSIRGKVGLRIKLGKLKERVTAPIDTVIKVDTIVQIINVDSIRRAVEDSLRREIENAYREAERVRKKTADSLLKIESEKLQHLDSLLLKASNMQNTTVEKVKTDGGKEAIKLNMNANVLFDVNKSILKQVAKDELLKLAVILRDEPGISIDIFGHTDNTGSLGLNQPLSQNRAQAVADYLISMGVRKSQILKIEGKNFSMPAATNATAEGRALNRRVEIYMYPAEK